MRSWFWWPTCPPAPSHGTQPSGRWSLEGGTVSDTRCSPSLPRAPPPLRTALSPGLFSTGQEGPDLGPQLFWVGLREERWGDGPRAGGWREPSSGPRPSAGGPQPPTPGSLSGRHGAKPSSTGDLAARTATSVSHSLLSPTPPPTDCCHSPGGKPPQDAGGAHGLCWRRRPKSCRWDTLAAPPSTPHLLWRPGVGLGARPRSFLRVFTATFK